MIVRGIDVGTLQSHYADVEKVGDVYVVRSFGKWSPPTSGGPDAVVIEFPSDRWYGRANTATVLKVAHQSAVIALYERTYCGTVRLVKFEEWAGRGTSRSEIDSVFLKLAEGAEKKRGRIYVNGELTNEHARDAALIAIWGLNHVK